MERKEVDEALEIVVPSRKKKKQVHTMRSCESKFLTRDCLPQGPKAA